MPFPRQRADCVRTSAIVSSSPCIDVDTDNKTILKTTMVVPPPHEPGLLPTWLQEQGADVIIAGGMGSRAQELFLGKGIQVVTGASQEVPAKVVADYLIGVLKTGSQCMRSLI